MSTITPVAQRLPEVGVWVLGYNAEYEPSKWRVMRLSDGGNWYSWGDCVGFDELQERQLLRVLSPTHWMPQPKFPPQTDTAL